MQQVLKNINLITPFSPGGH